MRTVTVNVEALAAVSNRLNCGEWPAELGPYRRPCFYSPRLRWWQRLGFRLLRLDRPMEQECRLAASIACMRLVDAIVGKKEVFRHWHTSGISGLNRTDEEFEAWWAENRGGDAAAPETSCH
jgi:hypothetical protein